MTLPRSAFPSLLAMLSGCPTADGGATHTALAAITARLDDNEERIGRLEASIAELKLEVATPMPSVAEVPPKPAPDQATEVPDGWVTCTDESEARRVCKTSRASITSVFANPELTRWGRLVPSRNGTVTEGFKLYGIRKGTPPAQLGLVVGDLALSVNDAALDSLEAVTGMAAMARAADELELQLRRAGKPFTIVLQIEDLPDN